MCNFPKFDIPSSPGSLKNHIITYASVFRSWKFLNRTNFNKSINAEIYVPYIRAQVKIFSTFTPMCIKTGIYVLTEGTEAFIAESRIREETDTRALMPPSLVKARRKVAWKARGKIRHCLFFFTTPYPLASEPEESQIAEAMKSMAGKSGLNARGEEGQTRRLTLHLQVHLAHLSEAVPQVHWKLFNHCQRESPSEGRGQRRKYALTSVRACVRAGGSKEPAAHSEAASYREKETSPASPSLPPSRLPVHSRSCPPAGPTDGPCQRRPLTFQIVL